MLAIKLLFSITLLLCSVAAVAKDADFVLKNRTGYRIDEVYVAVTASNKWGKNIMQTGSLRDGHYVKIVFPQGNGACNFDIKVKYDDGDVSSWKDVNLCKYQAISLYWNRKAQTTRAVGE